MRFLVTEEPPLQCEVVEGRKTVRRIEGSLALREVRMEHRRRRSGQRHQVRLSGRLDLNVAPCRARRQRAQTDAATAHAVRLLKEQASLTGRSQFASPRGDAAPHHYDIQVVPDMTTQAGQVHGRGFQPAVVGAPNQQRAVVHAHADVIAVVSVHPRLFIV